MWQILNLTYSRGGKRQAAYPSVKSFDSFLAKKPWQRVAIFYLGQTTLESVVVLS